MRFVLQDAGYAVRGLLRRPVFTIVVLATLALGVGANAAIFSVVNGILLKPLPYPHPERVVSFGHEPPQWLTSDPDFIDYHRDLTTFDGLAAYTKGLGTLTTGPEPERLRVVRASEDFFPLLGVAPMLGRVFAADEYQGNPPTTVVLSYQLWQRRFGGDRSIVNSTIMLNEVQRTVVGVMPPNFHFPEVRTDLWTPMPRFNLDSLSDRDNHYLFMVGRIKAGTTVERARADARLIASHIMRDDPRLFDPQHPLIPHIDVVGEQLVRNTRPYLAALLGAVAFVLLIACANVANLLLARSEGRRREMAVRSALGASSARLVTHMVAESGVLALAGGTLGLLAAWGGVRALIALAPASIPRLDEVTIDWRVVAFTIVISAITALSIAVIPAWRVTRGNSADALKSGGRTPALHGASRGARRALVITEVALAVVALSGAGMLLRSLEHLQSADLGFTPRGVLTARVSLPPREYGEERTELFFESLTDRVRAVPGVRAAGAAGWLPVVDAGGLRGVMAEGHPFEPGRAPLVVPQQATPGYFAAMGIPLIAGREFNAGDRADASPVAIVSAEMGKMFWPGESAIGHRFKLGSPAAPLMTVVGVAGEIRSRGFQDTPEPTMYIPLAQARFNTGYMPREMSMVIRTAGDPMALATTLRNQVRALDPVVPVSEVRTLEEVVGTSVTTRRFSTALLALFAAVALTLAGIGTYGVISYSVSQRTFEIGVRMALGAERQSVLALVMSEGLNMGVIGLGIGLAGSVVVARAIRAMLVGVSVVDLPALALASGLLVAVAVLASALPARRASAVSPTEALRGD